MISVAVLNESRFWVQNFYQLIRMIIMVFDPKKYLKIAIRWKFMAELPGTSWLHHFFVLFCPPKISSQNSHAFIDDSSNPCDLEMIYLTKQEKTIALSDVQLSERLASLSII